MSKSEEENENIVDFFDAVPDYDIEMYTHKKMKTDAESSFKE